mgnify:CR=1 FL=1
MRTYDNAWADADKARLAEIIAAGSTPATAAHLLNRTKPAILDMAHKVGCRWLAKSKSKMTYSRAEPEWIAVRCAIVEGDRAFAAAMPHRFEDAVVPPERGTVSRPDARSLTGNAAEMCAR